MRRPILSLSVGALLLAGSCLAQQSQQQNSTTPPDPNAPQQQDKKDGSNWSFEAHKGDKGSWKSTSSNPKPADPNAPPPLQADPQQQKKHSAAEDNPFPEAQSKQAAHEANGETSAPSRSDAAKPSDGDKQPGNQSGAYSSSQQQLQGIDILGDKDSKADDGAGGTIYDTKLAKQDTSVGGFYLKSGDFKGAYARFHEATRVDPGNADAVFGLAEAARGLKHHDEAVANYQLYLEALPDGPKAKQARKALGEMGAPAQ